MVIYFNSELRCSTESVEHIVGNRVEEDVRTVVKQSLIVELSIGNISVNCYHLRNVIPVASECEDIFVARE